MLLVIRKYVLVIYVTMSKESCHSKLTSERLRLLSIIGAAGVHKSAAFQHFRFRDPEKSGNKVTNLRDRRNGFPCRPTMRSGREAKLSYQAKLTKR